MSTEAAWVITGLVAQGCFAARFGWQWIVSERRRESVIPLAFWYLSLVGGLLLLSYAIYRRDPVFIIGQSMGAFVYVRNLVLIKRERSKMFPPSEQGLRRPHVWFGPAPVRRSHQQSNPKPVA